jgi:hypothetical protein
MDFYQNNGTQKGNKEIKTHTGANRANKGIS